MSHQCILVTSVYAHCPNNRSFCGLIKLIRELHNRFPIILYIKDFEQKIVKYPGITKCITVPNFGSCDYSFMRHIVDHYNTLEGTLIFTKINHTEPGYKIFLDHAHKWDFSDVGLFPIRLIYSKDYVLTEQDHSCRCEYMDDQYKEYYEGVFGGVEPPSFIDVWGHGPHFSVSARLIKRHPKQVYQYLLDKIVEGDHKYKGKYNPVHDIFGRFYRLLFTHNLPAELSGNIQQYNHTAYPIDRELTTHDLSPSLVHP